MNIFKSNFPELSNHQISKLDHMKELYEMWNKKINVISRKDISEINTRHILHSLSIAKILKFKEKSKIFDVGTGGGFPGIPLSILNPNSEFTLCDSVGKKIKVVESIVKQLELKNVRTLKTRSENVREQFDFIVCRAVTNMSDFLKIVDGKISPKNNHKFNNGIFYLKGGDLSIELKNIKNHKVFEIKDFFKDSFFESKKIVYVPISCKDKYNQ